MKIVASTIVPYQRCLARAIETSHGRYRERRGFLLVLRDELGNTAVGDAAPLPGLSVDTLDECEQALHQQTRAGGQSKSAAEYFSEKGVVTRDGRPMLEKMELWSPPTWECWLPKSPAAFFAAATALGELKSKRKNLSLSRAINEGAAGSVPVNGLITERTVANLVRQAKTLELQGFSRLKMKVGLDHPGDDIARISAACDAAPNTLLRLDANGGWDIRWADSVLSSIPRSQIEFIEQPFPRGQWSEARRITAKYHVRLALDEDIQTLEEAEVHIQNRACDVIVLKPMIVGRLYQCFLLAQKAQEAGLEVIYTSSWESDIGIAATLHLAAALGPNPPAMGLSTAGMIADGIVKTPLKIEYGFLKVPDGPGLGIELAPDFLAKLNL